MAASAPKRAWIHTGMSTSPEYLIYQMAKQRCTNPKSQRWYTHGARGIKFLFKSFAEFYAEIGPRLSPEHSLERVDNNGNYEVGNIKWATRSEQQKNKRFFGKGYSWSASQEKWHAHIMHRGTEIWLGVFEKEAEAKKAVLMARITLLKELA